MESVQLEKWLNDWKSILLNGMFGAFITIHENRGDRIILTFGRTDNRIRSPRLKASGQID